MEIIYNNDGSIKFLNITEYIGQNSNLVNKVFVAIEDYDTESYTLKAGFTLPDGTVNEITATSTETQTIEGSVYNGRSFYLTQAQTQQAGIVGMSISVMTNNSVLWSYSTKLTVNDSPSTSTTELITNAQYNALLQTLANYQLKYVAANVRSYNSVASAEIELPNIAENQLITITTSNSISFYFKQNGVLTFIADIIGSSPTQIIARLEALESGQTTLQSSVSSLNTTVGNHTTQIGTANSNITTLQGNVEDLGDEIESVDDSLESYKTSNNSRLTNDETTLSNHTTSINSLDNNLSNLTTTVNNHTTNINSLDNSVSGLSTTVGSHTSSISTLNSNVSSLSTTVGNHTSSINALNNDVDDLDTTVSGHTNSITQINNNITNINTTLGSHTSSISSLESDVDTLQDDVADNTNWINESGATKTFVNSSIASATGNFKGTFNSVSELPTTSVSNNDYAFVKTTDSQGNEVYNRYKYNGTSWVFEYALNNSSFTAAQWNAINSGIDSTKATQIGTNTTNITTLTNTVGGHTSSISTLQDDLADAENDIAENMSDIADLQGDMTSAQSTIATHTTNISNLQTDLDAAETQIATNTTNISSLTTTVNGQAQSITSLNTTVNGQASSIASLNTTVEGQASSISTLQNDVSQATSIGQAAQTTANSKNKIYRQDSVPTDAISGDLWFYTGTTTSTYTNGKWYIYNGSTWNVCTDSQIASIQTSLNALDTEVEDVGDRVSAIEDDYATETALNSLTTRVGTLESGVSSKGTIYRQATAPTGANTHDLWYCTGSVYSYTSVGTFSQTKYQYIGYYIDINGTKTYVSGTDQFSYITLGTTIAYSRSTVYYEGKFYIWESNVWNVCDDLTKLNTSGGSTSLFYWDISTSGIDLWSAGTKVLAFDTTSATLRNCSISDSSLTDSDITFSRYAVSLGKYRQTLLDETGYRVYRYSSVSSTTATIQTNYQEDGITQTGTSTTCSYVISSAIDSSHYAQINIVEDTRSSGNEYGSLISLTAVNGDENAQLNIGGATYPNDAQCTTGVVRDANGFYVKGFYFDWTESKGEGTSMAINTGFSWITSVVATVKKDGTGGYPPILVATFSNSINVGTVYVMIDHTFGVTVADFDGVCLMVYGR